MKNILLYALSQFLFFSIYAQTNSSCILASFKVEAEKDNRVEISWNTETEVNLIRFELERSLDNISFTKLLEVPINEDSYTPRVYGYIENIQLNSEVFYRLKVIGRNKYVQISDTLSVKAYQSDSMIIYTDIYPQPVNDFFTIAFSGNKEVPVLIQILDIMGQKHYEAQVIPAEGEQYLYFRVSDWQKGIYFIYLYNEECKYVYKMLLQ